MDISHKILLLFSYKRMIFQDRPPVVGLFVLFSHGNCEFPARPLDKSAKMSYNSKVINYPKGRIYL